MYNAYTVTEKEADEKRVQFRYGYPWSEWFNGESWIIPWDTLRQSPRAFRGLLYKQASRRKLVVQCHKSDDDSCWIVRCRGEYQSSN